MDIPNDILHYLLDKCNMGLDDVQNEIENMNYKKYLNMHKEKIWQAKDGRFKTHLPNRKLLAKATEEQLNQALVDYYKSLDAESKKKAVTLRVFYPEWLEHKKLYTNATTYIRRVDCDWNKYYLNDSMIDIPLVKLTTFFLDEWAHRKVKELSLTKHQYYNMTLIIRHALEYAKTKNIVSDNAFSKVHMESKLLRKEKKPDDKTQVYLLDEQPLIENLAYQDFQEHTNSNIPLAIPLAFQLGVRLGELVALKFTDIDGNYIHIQRMEVKEEKQAADGTWLSPDRKIVDYTKSEAGDRYVYLSSTAKKIIQMAQERNIENQYLTDDFIFFSENGRAVSSGVYVRIRKYCHKTNIITKSPHKIRKTFISSLIDGNMNINEIRKQVGHSDERTTYKNYCFNRMSDKQTENLMENILTSVCNHV